MTQLAGNRSYCHRGGEPPLLGVTIAEQFATTAARHADHDAVVSLPQRRRLSYRELAVEADGLARGLLGIGVGKGDRVGIWSTNNIEWLLLQLATARIGAILVNINPAYRPRELAWALQRAEVQYLFTIPAFRSSDYVAMLLELLPELAQKPDTEAAYADLPALRRVVIYDPAAPAETPRPQPGFLTWPELLLAGGPVGADALDAAGAVLDPDEAINIQYTSGTTGFPKAVVLSHHNILNNAWFT